MNKKKKDDIIIVPDFSFEEAMQHLANVKASDVDEAMKADNQDEETANDEDCEPPQEC